MINYKKELLQAIAGKNRGLLATEKDKVQILTAVERLEDHNPTADPLDKPDLLNGDWRLLYTTSKNILGLDNLPFVKLGEIYQCIRTEGSKIYNIAEIMGLPFLEGLISVAAKIDTVSSKRVNVRFQRSIIGLQKVLGYISPRDLINKIEMGKVFPAVDLNWGNFPWSDRNLLFSSDKNEGGWLEITYLDEDLRIGRGNQGNVFILEKC